MFKEKFIDGKKVFYSTMLDVEHFFTSRELVVDENKEIVANYLNVTSENLIKPRQVHSANIEVVQDEKYQYENCDALILNTENKAIYLNFADCTPVILYDTKNNIAAISHAGWRGTAQEIAPKTVLKMKEIFNTNPIDVIALIGPCISFENFETSKDAIEQLSKTVEDKTGLFKDNFADLKGINKRQLEQIGVQKIDVCQFCTIDDNDKFFSYRKENKTTKRHSAVIKL